METSEEIKAVVKEKYARIAEQPKEQNQASCCGEGSCCSIDYAVFAENYAKLKGYTPEADLGLGCGLPTEFAQIRTGDTVIDLGSGAGNDVFVARTLVGETGKVIGVDMTEAMIEKARANNDHLGFNNVEFRLGDIEHMPITSNKADVVISNCVLNLVPDKTKAFREIFRILKPGGHFSISDVVLQGELPPALRRPAELYAGCVSGAMPKADYLDIIQRTGFQNIAVVQEKTVRVPDDILLAYITPDELREFKASGTQILSITVYGRKHESTCCSGGSSC